MIEIIPASLYNTIYLLIVLTFSFFIFNKYIIYEKGLDLDSFKRSNIVFLAVLMIFFIGLRPDSGVFVDMMNTIVDYRTFYEGRPFKLRTDTDNLIYDNFLAWTGSLCLGTPFFFTAIASIYFGAAYWGIRRLFPLHTAIVYLAFLGAFSTFSYATNGVKAGAAASMFILAVSYYRHWKICLPLLAVCYGFHHSMQLPIVAFLFACYWKNTKHFFAGWLFCLLCAAAHVTFFQELFAGMTDDQGAGYLNSVGQDWSGKSGFRIDFVLYSFMPVLVGYYAIFKKQIQSPLYEVLLKVYLLVNGVWMLCMYAAFTNRIAYLSWSLYPILLLYPFLNEEWGENQFQIGAKVFMCHLGFTLFMSFIYY